ncbi:MAG TPA: DUF1573 domain-containing protein [Flavobacteriaceae bacterium]|nr:DUF1573 domain-containing protein [Flavobacteriaceae bacterium]
MKKSLILLATAVAFSLFSCKDNAVNKVEEEKVVAAEQRDESMETFPVMSFEEEQFDFGEIVQGTHVEHVFSFTNTGDAPLVITNARSSCGCTVPEYPREPVAPGESGELLVKFDGSGRGTVNKNITLTTNTEKGMERLRIRATVNPKQ